MPETVPFADQALQFALLFNFGLLNQVQIITSLIVACIRLQNTQQVSLSGVALTLLILLFRDL